MLIASLQEDERFVSQLARKLNTSIPTTYHLLNTLVDARLVSRDEGRRYHLGPVIAMLAAAYRRQTVPPTELVATVRHVARVSGEAAYLSMWRDFEIEIVAQASGTHAVQVVNLAPGFYSNGHARASGKVLLAFAERELREAYIAAHPLRKITEYTITSRDDLLTELEHVYRQKFATEEEEFAEGVACISVPVLMENWLVGAITISSPVERYRSAKMEYLGYLQNAVMSLG